MSFPKTNCFDHCSSSSAIIDTSINCKHKHHQRVTTKQISNKQPKIKQTNKQTNKKQRSNEEQSSQGLPISAGSINFDHNGFVAIFTALF